MKSMSRKTNLGRKATTVLALSATLAATLLAASPAFALTRGVSAYVAPDRYTVTAYGEGRTSARASADARNLRCFGNHDVTDTVISRSVSLFNNTWFTAKVVLHCKGGGVLFPN